MIKQIRTSKSTKIIACYLSLMIFLEMVQPMVAYALTEGPSQPEFNSFTPIGTSDMVDLSSGDMNYNIPIMDVGGYPINLAYSSGVTMDQEASWVGLGWNLNVGQINRNVRGMPDDFKGDFIRSDNNFKDNVTIGVVSYLNVQLIGALDNIGIGTGADMQYNNYIGVRAVPSMGATFGISDNVSVGFKITGDAENGSTVTANVGISATKSQADNASTKFASLCPSITYNSRQGLQSFNLGSSIPHLQKSGSLDISFANNTYTPCKRLAYKNNSFRLSFSGGGDVYGVHGEVSQAGYATVQKLASKIQYQASYGYENTEFSGMYGQRDFNREFEPVNISKNTLVLPVTNYTYDLYSLKGQGIEGTFRPVRSRIGHVFDPTVSDISGSNSIGIEVEAGAGAHSGKNDRETTTTSHTGLWSTVVTPFFIDPVLANSDYQKVYYRNTAEMVADQGTNELLSNFGQIKPITLMIDGYKNAINAYASKNVLANQSLLNTPAPFTNPRRTSRETRNQVIQKFTKGEVDGSSYAPFFKYNLVKSVNNPERKHHTAGYIVTDEKGARHIYGETVYNKEKREVSFNVGDNNKAPGHSALLAQGLVGYNATDNTMLNKKGRDHYFNRVITPGYAHTFLLSSELSPDYEDLTGNGPTDDDLGRYTKFIYENKGEYKWRVPYGLKTASYNEGLNTDVLDQKGSYLYGVKQNKYLKAIVTKTHVAFVDLEERSDANGVNSEDGGGSYPSTQNHMYCIKSIRLYAKSDVNFDLLSEQPQITPGAVPIKTAFFEYNYNLCPNIENNFGKPHYINDIDVNSKKGKLTLTKVYFTYRNSKMGKYTPYKFEYGNTDDSGENPKYNPKAYDIWGNYKPYKPNSWLPSNPDSTPQEFPYVDQSNENSARDAALWSLKVVRLPSGGRIAIEYESDDYQYVQDKRAMQMFKVAGVCKESEWQNYNGALTSNKLFDGAESDRADYVAIKLPPQYLPSAADRTEVIKKYTEGLAHKSIYFNFLLNMTPNSFDYVSGYFEMDGKAKINDNGFLLIPMKKINREGKLDGNATTNPITVAGCFFAKQNLNAQVNGLSDPGGSVPPNVVGLAKSLTSGLQDMMTIFKGGNKKFMEKGCSRYFYPKKSWIRLLEPSKFKKGGGSRVRSVTMDDQWNTMIEHGDETQRYLKRYGQKYTYTLEDGLSSSGVATFEPNNSKENPLVMPFNNKPEKLVAQSYQEMPFGSSFYPSPTVTYRRVVCKNIAAGDEATGAETSRTGTIVTKHYTSYDFPTVSDLTNLDLNKRWDSNEGQLGGMLKGMLGLKVNTHSDLTLSQGFSIMTNDMNGKLRKQEIFNNANALISSVEYKYSTVSTDDRVLDNKVQTVNENGVVSDTAELGKNIDIVNDSRESYSNTISEGKSFNQDIIPLGPYAILAIALMPERAEHTKFLHTMVTTKVVHKTGIIKEKIVIDAGGSVASTKNLLWDAKTGQVVLTETSNDYNDVYYTLTYPAYWHYNEMGHSSNNIDFTGALYYDGEIDPAFPGRKFFKLSTPEPADVSTILKPGDELIFDKTTATPQRSMWVCDYNTAKSRVGLMLRSGEKVLSLTHTGNPNRKFRIVRSAYRNNQMATMQTIVLKQNPITNVGTQTIIDPKILNSSTNPDIKIINASAIEYKGFWPSQCENGLPQPTQTNINEYVLNIKGEWKPTKSYAYLTGRNTSIVSNTRKAGYFTKFSPFYKRTDAGQWPIDFTNWTFASEVTQINPYGAEIENRDALDRYSAAQYGYKYTLPVAIASNSKYSQMGFDGFEDYPAINWVLPATLQPHFGFNQTISAQTPISGAASHTGKKSILIKPQQKISFTRKINGCNTPAN